MAKRNGLLTVVDAYKRKEQIMNIYFIPLRVAKALVAA